MKIEFKNGSVIQHIDSNKPIRGKRGNHLECPCYDIESDEWIIGKPLLNEDHIPAWTIEEILKNEG